MKSTRKKTVVIVGAGQMGLAMAQLLNPNEMTFVGFADNDANKWTMPDGSYPDPDKVHAKPYVFSIEAAVGLEPNQIIISVTGEERARELKEQLRICRFYGEILYLEDIKSIFDVRGKSIQLMLERMKEKVPGAIAELGVYQGDLAWQLNAAMPDRSFYLFDTFEGFNEADVVKEKTKVTSLAKPGDFWDTSEKLVLSRMHYPDKCIIRKGHFPETTAGLSNVRFAFVSLDADLYAPTLAGMEFFYPRMNKGGIIVLHDYDSIQFEGVKLAVKEYEEKILATGGEPLKIVPLADLHGSCVIMK